MKTLNDFKEDAFKDVDERKSFLKDCPWECVAKDSLLANFENQKNSALQDIIEINKEIRRHRTFHQHCTDCLKNKGKIEYIREKNNLTDEDINQYR